MIVLGLLVIGSVICFVAGISLGSVDISLYDLLYSEDPIVKEIVSNIRIPRTALTFLTGGVLALAGLNYQTLFRNPLATPFTLGVATAGSLGATIAILYKIEFGFIFFDAVNILSFAGSLFGIGLIYIITGLFRLYLAESILLAGVAIGFILSSVNMLLHYLSDRNDIYAITRWLMGDIATYGYSDLWLMFGFALVLILVTVYYARELEIFAAGEIIAITRGVDVNYVRNFVLISTSTVVGGVVSLTGPIGFVGMMSPHIIRFLIGGSIRIIGFATFFLGGIILLISEIISIKIVSPATIPVGVITAILGAPFFLLVLVRKGG